MPLGVAEQRRDGAPRRGRFARDGAKQNAQTDFLGGHSRQRQRAVAPLARLRLRAAEHGGVGRRHAKNAGGGNRPHGGGEEARRRPEGVYIERAEFATLEHFEQVAFVHFRRK